MPDDAAPSGTVSITGASPGDVARHGEEARDALDPRDALETCEARHGTGARRERAEGRQQARSSWALEEGRGGRSRFLGTGRDEAREPPRGSAAASLTGFP